MLSLPSGNSQGNRPSSTRPETHGAHPPPQQPDRYTHSPHLHISPQPHPPSPAHPQPVRPWQFITIYIFNSLTFSFQMVPFLCATGSGERKWSCGSPSATAIVHVTKPERRRPNEEAVAAERRKPTWGKWHSGKVPKTWPAMIPTDAKQRLI